MRRVACIALPEVRLEVAKSEGSSLLAVVIARPGGAVQSERDVLGNTRLDVVSREARRLGVRAGQTVASARAKCAALNVRVVAEAAVQTALARIAEVALAFGPTVAFDVAHDVVWVDVGGCAHLHGGEGELARALEACVLGLGHACRVAVASGPRVASAVARFAPARRGSPLVVPAGKEAAAMGVLPLAALAFDEDTSIWLRDLGLSTCGDLQRLPRRSLGTRLGARAHDVMQLLDGEDGAPLVAWRPPQVPEERVELEWGAASIEALAFVIKTLCDRLAARLAGRAMSAARLELCLALDRALCRDEAPVSSLEVTLPSPIASAADLLAVLRARLERVSLPAPVLAATLRAPELARNPARTLDLLSPEPKSDRALPRLVAEIGAELGPACIGILSLVDTWAPEQRTCILPFARIDRTASHSLEQSSLDTSALEPTRLVSPVLIDRDELVCPKQLMRVQTAQWWRGDGNVGAGRRDLVAAWVEHACGHGHGHGHGFVELCGKEASLRGWID
jgi:protein ImuB